MSLILLHRLKFSIRDDVLLLILLTLLYTLKINVTRANDVVPPELSRGLPLYGDLSGSDVYDSIHRILRDEENTFRNENVRWTKIDDADRLAERRVRRDATTTTVIRDSHDDESDSSVAKINSTKIVNFSNRSLYDIDFNSLDVKDTIFSDILVLNFSNNKIELVKDDTAAKLVNVIQLDLSSNRIKCFNSTFNKLTMLNLSQNRLTTFKSEHLRNLNTLDLSCNNISDPNDLRLDHLSDLNRLDLSCNNLIELHRTLFLNTTNLKVLNLSCNRLPRILKNYFFNLVNMEVLQLSNNNISEIENDTFVYLPNLQYLDLSYNRIDASSIRALQGIPDLIGLSLAYNEHLGNALQGFVASWSLKELDASGTGLCQIPAALAQSVHSLNISDNHFQIIRCGDLDSYPLLQHLDVSWCEIMDIEDDAMGRLEILVTLRLSHNNLARVPTSLPTSLVNLYLQHNQISDIQPNAFAQMTNLEILNMAGNKLTYLPGLPLPKLVTLNLRSAGLKGLSQMVVKSSPNIKDLLLDGNPIKCSELLGIAEWATPCRSERTFELVDIDGPNQKIASEATDDVFQSFRRQYNCPRDRMSRPKKPVCIHEKLISTGQLSYNDKLNVSSLSINLTEVVSDTHTTAIPPHPLENKTVESTSKDTILNRKLSGKEMTLVNKSMGLNENIATARLWGPRAAIDVNGESNITGHLTENDVKSNNQDNKIPPLSIPERRRNEAKILSGAVNADETKMPTNKVTKSGKSASLRTAATAPAMPPTLADNKWKNIEIGYNKKSEVLPNRQKYFTNQTRSGKTKLAAAEQGKDPGMGDPPVKKNNYLHKTVNQTFYTNNKNVFKAKTALFSATNKFNENHTINSDAGSGFNSGGDKTVHPAADNVRNATEIRGHDANGSGGILSVSESGVEKKGVMATVAAEGRLWVSSKKGVSAGGKVSVIKVDTKDGQEKGPSTGTENTEKISDASVSNLDTDIYQRDEEHGRLKPMLHTDDSEDRRPSDSDQPNASRRDKLDHLAESLAQMMTAQKDNNVLSRTGLPNAKLDIIGDVTPLSKQEPNNSQKQWAKQQLQTQQSGTNGGHYKNDTINWTTNKAISHENNENGNRKQEQEAKETGNGGTGGNEDNVSKGNSNFTATKVLQRVQTIDPANKFAVRTIEMAAGLIIKSNQSGSGAVTTDNKQSHTTEMANDGADQGSRKQHLRSGISTDENGRSGDINGNDKSWSPGKAKDRSVLSPKQQPLSQIPITSSPRADNNKTISGKRELGLTSTKEPMSDVNKVNENKLNGRRNMKIKINRNPLNVGKDSVNGMGVDVVAKPNELNKKCANVADANGGAGNTECENDIYIAENPLNTQPNGGDSYPAKHNTLNKDKLINNIVAENNNDVMARKKSLASVGSLLTSTVTSHHRSSVNEAREHGSPAAAEPQSNETITKIQKQQHSDHIKESNSNANNGNNGDNGISNTSASSGRPEQWNDVRTATSHPGLFVVIGVTIGVIVSLGLIHLYRCRKPWHRQRNNYPDDDQEQYTPAHRDLLPMEILSSTSIHYTDAPIELW